MAFLYQPQGFWVVGMDEVGSNDVLTGRNRSTYEDLMKVKESCFILSVVGFAGQGTQPYVAA